MFIQSRFNLQGTSFIYFVHYFTKQYLCSGNNNINNYNNTSLLLKISEHIKNIRSLRENQYPFLHTIAAGNTKNILNDHLFVFLSTCIIFEIFMRALVNNLDL